jgi:hypothetical protein
MRFAADENFNGRILERLCQRFEDLDIVRIQDTDFYGAPDPSNRDYRCRALFLFPIHSLLDLLSMNLKSHSVLDSLRILKIA